jgi:hypothetical protein
MIFYLLLKFVISLLQSAGTIAKRLSGAISTYDGLCDTTVGYMGK